MMFIVYITCLTFLLTITSSHMTSHGTVPECKQTVPRLVIDVDMMLDNQDDNLNMSKNFVEHVLSSLLVASETINVDFVHHKNSYMVVSNLTDDMEKSDKIIAIIKQGAYDNTSNGMNDTETFASDTDDESKVLTVVITDNISPHSLEATNKINTLRKYEKSFTIAVGSSFNATDIENSFDLITSGRIDSLLTLNDSVRSLQSFICNVSYQESYVKVWSSNNKDMVIKTVSDLQTNSLNEVKTSTEVNQSFVLDFSSTTFPVHVTSFDTSNNAQAAIISTQHGSYSVGETLFLSETGHETEVSLTPSSVHKVHSSLQERTMLMPSVNEIPTLSPSETEALVLMPSVTEIPTLLPSETEVLVLTPSVTEIPTLLPSETEVLVLTPSVTEIPTLLPSETEVLVLMSSVSAFPVFSSTSDILLIRPPETEVPVLSPFLTDISAMIQLSIVGPDMPPSLPELSVTTPTLTDVSLLLSVIEGKTPSTTPVFLPSLSHMHPVLTPSMPEFLSNELPFSQMSVFEKSSLSILNMPDSDNLSEVTTQLPTETSSSSILDFLEQSVLSVASYESQVVLSSVESPILQSYSELPLFLKSALEQSPDIQSSSELPLALQSALEQSPDIQSSSELPLVLISASESMTSISSTLQLTTNVFNISMVSHKSVALMSSYLEPQQQSTLLTTQPLSLSLSFLPTSIIFSQISRINDYQMSSFDIYNIDTNFITTHAHTQTQHFDFYLPFTTSPSSSLLYGYNGVNGENQPLIPDLNVSYDSLSIYLNDFISLSHTSKVIYPTINHHVNSIDDHIPQVYRTQLFTSPESSTLLQEQLETSTHEALHLDTSVIQHKTFAHYTLSSRLQSTVTWSPSRTINSVIVDESETAAIPNATFILGRTNSKISTTYIWVSIVAIIAVTSAVVSVVAIRRLTRSGKYNINGNSSTKLKQSPETFYLTENIA